MSPTILRTACACAALLLGCAESKGKGAEPPGSQGAGAASGGSGRDAQCPAGGPSVSLNIRGHAGGDELPSDELGALLGWIGGFAQPCREATPETPHFTLEIQLGESGQPPTLELVDRATLPGLAACIDANFAKAPPPPPPGSMTVEIVIPWGCSTLGPGFQPGKKAEPAPEPTPAAAPS
jgi:hypothetical protein